MAKLSHADSRRMYSWWWDSHISPKNSKWLQENLTDMDAKVKAMIKLIEEDADSFARKAEMYYKKRPELMKLVEEFYRAYRALAERYDHATGVIRHAHKTMAEAFPNQLPMGFADDPDPQTPKSTPARTLFEPDELQRNGDNDPNVKGRGLKQVNDLFGSGGGNAKFPDGGRVRKGLNFHDSEEKQHDEDELRKAIAQLEAEKEAGRVQYQQALEKLSELETRIARAEEDSRGLGERASKAEAEVQTLKEALSEVETEKELNLHEYRQCLEKISGLENSLSELTKAETEARSLKAEKDKALDQYIQSLETISKLENELRRAEEDTKRLNERAERAESEIEALKQAISELTREKEAAATQYQKCLETISSLEAKLSRLNSEIDNGVAKLKDAEEQNLLLERLNRSLQSTVESLTQKTGNQSRELTEKQQELTERQQELGRLWACIQEERLRFVEAETAFQTLQHLHGQVQEELRSLTSELQNRVHLLRELETDNRRLQDEIAKAKDEHMSSSVTIKSMQDDISSLSEAKGKLEEEVELRVDQRNALQQEIYCLKKQLNDLNEKHRSILEQVHAIGFDPERLESSVKELRTEKEVLTEKLKLFDQLVEKNSVLENSLSDMSAELDAVRAKITALENSCQAELNEKNENLEKLSAKNTVLENSLSDAHDELQSLKEKSRGLEDSCQILTNENLDLLGEQGRLIDQLQTALLRLENLEKTHESSIQTCKKQLADMESEMHLLQEEYEDKALDSQIQIFVLQKTAQDLQGKSSSLLTEYHKTEEENQQHVVENSVLLALLRELKLKAENKSVQFCVLQSEAVKLQETNEELKSKIKEKDRKEKLLEVQIENLHSEKASTEHEYKDKSDQFCLLQIEAVKLQETNEEMKSKIEEKDRKEKLLELQIENLHSEKASIEQEYKHKSDQFCLLQIEAVKLQETNEEMKSKIEEKDHKEKLLEVQIEKLHEENASMAKEISVLEEENYAVCGEMLSLESLSTVFKNCIDEKSSELNKLNEINGEIGEKLSLTEKMLEELKLEKLNLITALQKSEDELNTITLLKNQLDRDIEAKNSSLSEKENKLQEIERKLSLTENEKSELHRNLQNLIGDHTEAKRTTEDLAKQIVSLSTVSDDLKAENGKMKEQNEALHSELQMQQNEIRTLESEMEELFRELQGSTFCHGLYEEKVRELIKASESLEAEITFKDVETKLLNERNTVLEAENKDRETQLAMWESDGEEIFGELISSTVCHSLYEQKVGELVKVSESLEADITSKDVDTKLLKERITILNSENEDHKTQLASWESDAEALYGELLISSICHGLYEQKVHELVKMSETFEAESTSKDEDIKLLNAENESLTTQLAACGAAVASLSQCISSLEKHTYRKLQKRHNEATEAIEVADNRSNTEEKNDIARDPFLDLQDLAARLQAVEKALLKIDHRKNSKRANQIVEADDGILTKDIMLDQISESSPHDRTKRAENQNLELWETSNRAEKYIDFRRVNSIKKPKGEAPLVVDKWEISKRSVDLREGGNNNNKKKKVLERLNSDVLKLTNLHITVNDLKSKLESTEKSRRGGMERESLMGQLNEAEAAIQKLFDQSGKLMKNYESGGSFSSDSKSTLGLEENESLSRRRINEQAQRVSEKIGRLQLEVQKMQFVLLKLDDNEGKESKGTKSRISEAKRRVLLQDYLYGGVRPGNKQKKKKTPFCACVKPPTQGD